jgi:hypothetical protein
MNYFPHNRERRRFGLVVGLSAAAFGAAVLASATTAPTARADDFSEIVTAVDGDLTAGQDTLEAAYTDFSGGELTAGLASFFDSVDDDGLSAPNNLLVGALDALSNEPILSYQPWNVDVPTDFADGLSNAESDFSFGTNYLSEIPTFLSEGAYGNALEVDLFGTDLISIAPLEELLLGSFASL